MTYRIITDSSCDFNHKQYQDTGVLCAPLTVLYKGRNHDNFTRDADVKAFYDGLRAGEMASTAAANPEAWAAVLRPVLEQGQDALVLAFSSGLSTTYQSAVIAAQDLKEEFPQRTVHVIDTRSAALGQGLLVWYACQKQSQGLSLEENAAWLEENKFHLCHWFTVENLETLKRGGRVSAATALVGTMLNIKPVMHMDDAGHLINMEKVRGRKASIEALAKKYGQLSPGWDNEAVFIGHGDCLEDAQLLADILTEQYGARNITLGFVGPVIGAHTGPGVLALFFLGEHR